MDSFKWNKRRLIFLNNKSLFSFGNPSHTRDHNPMFGTMMVHLRNKFLTWFNGDPFNQVIFPTIDDVVFTPWTENFQMLLTLGSVVLL
ncbi:Uncharacterised protein [Kluyvera intermedia]|nr:Uncharacterised protein [Kluyvera intermedia]